jgi:hypothetical protein
VMRSAALPIGFIMAAASSANAMGVQDGSCHRVTHQNVSPPIAMLSYLRVDEPRFPKESHLRCAVSNGRIVECEPDTIHLSTLAKALIGRAVIGLEGRPACVSFRLIIAD